MNIVLYTLMTYGVTAIVSLAVIAIVVVIGKVMGKNEGGEKNG